VFAGAEAAAGWPTFSAWPVAMSLTTFMVVETTRAQLGTQDARASPSVRRTRCGRATREESLGPASVRREPQSNVLLTTALYLPARNKRTRALA
jgi:hypothetical protein